MLPSDATRQLLIIGQGYVGLPLAQAAISAGHTVHAHDTNDAKVTAISAGRSPIEDVTDADLQAMRETGRYYCTTTLPTFQPFDVAIVTVPTPLRDGRPDLTAVLAAARTIGHALAESARRLGKGFGLPLVVLESTVAPGTTAGVFTRALEQASRLCVGLDFHVAFSPERIDPGNPQWKFANTPKLVGGVAPTATQLAADFYGTICAQVHTTATAEEAEAAKLLENTYRHVNVALVNELGRHLRAMGIDIWNVVRAAATKPYGFQAFYPGPGVGGHCLPVDPAYLADAVQRATGAGFDFIELAMQVNRGQPAYVVQRIMELLNDGPGRAVKGSEILVVGAAYKRDSGDMRESPAVEIIERLAQLGAEVTVYDPCASSDDMARLAGAGGYGDVWPLQHPADLARQLQSGPKDGAAGDRYHLAVILTDHENVPYGEIVRTVPWVLDTRGKLETSKTVVAL